MYFLDIETVHSPYSIDQSPVKELFKKRFEKDDVVAYGGVQRHWESKAGMYAEFGKVVCVCVAKISGEEIHIKTFSSRFEHLILKKLAETIDQSEKVIPLCAHNGLEFDFPYLYRRYLINNIPVPRALQINAQKKWEWPLRDTMPQWSHSQWNYKASLDLIAQSLGFDSPKGFMRGDQVSSEYYGMFSDPNDEETVSFNNERDAFDKIGHYCRGDVFALAQVYCKMNGLQVPTKIILKE